MAISKTDLKAGMREAVKSAPTANIVANSPLAAMLGNTRNTENEVVEMELSLLDTHPEQSHYSMNEDEQNTLTNSISQVGVLEPIHIRPAENGRYTILAGHRRSLSAKQAGLKTIPAIIHNCDDKTATIYFHVTNLERREKLLPSEKAYGYEQVEKSLQDKGATNGRTTAAIAELTGDNVKQIQRYRRLLLLIPELICAVDNGDMPVRAGVDLSFLNNQTQQILLDTMNQLDISLLSMKQAADIRELGGVNGEINVQDIVRYFKPEKKKAIKEMIYKFSNSTLAPLLPIGLNRQEVEDYIINALTEYKNKEK